MKIIKLLQNTTSYPIGTTWEWSIKTEKWFFSHFGKDINYMIFDEVKK